MFIQRTTISALGLVATIAMALPACTGVISDAGNPGANSTTGGPTGSGSGTGSSGSSGSGSTGTGTGTGSSTGTGSTGGTGTTGTGGGSAGFACQAGTVEPGPTTMQVL